MTVIINSDSQKAWVEGRILPHIFNAISGLPGKKKYVRGVPYFSVDRANLEYLDSTLQDIQWNGPAAKEISKYKQLRAMEKKAREMRGTDAAPIAFAYKHKPYSHQNKAFALARGKIAFGYFMEMGTGKTKVQLDDAADLHLNGGVNGKIDTFIIIAPNGVHAQWVNEQIPEHLSPAVDYRAAYTGASLSREEQNRMSETLKFKGGLRIFAIHIDSMSHKKGQEFLRQILLGGNCLIAIDESSRIKDSNSKRTKFLIEVGKLAKYRRIMTGTPISQGAEDLYSQFAFLDPDILGYGSFFAFRNHFCRLGGFQNKKIIGYANEQELMDKIDSHTYRVLKDDCLDLPERNYITRQVLMHPEQQRIYDQVRKDFFVELDQGILTAKMAVQRITRLQQIVNGFIWKNAKKDKYTGEVIEPFMYQEFPQNRVQATIDIIKETNPNTKVIVWIKFQGDYKLLSEAFEKEGIGFTDYVGATPTEVRAEHIERFRTDPKCKVFLATPRAGGIGLNLTCASEVIWFSRDWSLENELQANDRVHRIGQRKVVNYHFLTSPKTVDEKIDKALKSKQSVADNLIDLRELAL
jgi:hypothetical protein